MAELIHPAFGHTVTVPDDDAAEWELAGWMPTRSDPAEPDEDNASEPSDEPAPAGTGRKRRTR